MKLFSRAYPVLPHLRFFRKGPVDPEGIIAIANFSGGCDDPCIWKSEALAWDAGGTHPTVVCDTYISGFSSASAAAASERSSRGQ